MFHIELTGILGCVLVEVEVHAQVDGHAESEPAKHCCAEEDINQHRCLEQRKQSPLVVIVRHVARSPNFKEGLEQPDELLPESRRQIDGCISTPRTIGSVSGDKGAALCHDPRDDQGDSSREDQSRWPAEGTLAHRREGSKDIAITRLFERLESTDIASQEGEDGDTQTALPRNTEDGPLQNSGRVVNTVAGSEEVIIPCSGKVSEDNQEGGDSS